MNTEAVVVYFEAVFQRSVWRTKWNDKLSECTIETSSVWSGDGNVGSASLRYGSCTKNHSELAALQMRCISLLQYLWNRMLRHLVQIALHGRRTWPYVEWWHFIHSVSAQDDVEMLPSPGTDRILQLPVSIHRNAVPVAFPWRGSSMHDSVSTSAPNGLS